jgi:hypothetical protein
LKNLICLIATSSFFTLASTCIFIACSAPSEKNEWTVLLDNDLEGWDTYIGPSFDTVRNKWDSISLGLNNDLKHVFTITNADNTPALRISGELFGGISTKQEFENYHLQMEFKWGELTWAPRKKGKRDSGVLYHAVGPHGADGNFWMRSQEFQVQEGDCGDYWGVAGGVFDIPAVLNADSNFVYDPAGPLVTFSSVTGAGRHCIKDPDGEKPTGNWNRIDIYCSGDTSVHVVNNVVNMILYRSRQHDDGTETPLTKGKIQLQSEGAEVFYRNIRIRNLDKIPAEIFNPSTRTGAR